VIRDENKATSADIVFVSMPFGSVRLPSIGLSLLQASLRENGIRSTIEYPALEFAAGLGVENYERIAGSAPELLIGEWIFSKAAFGSCAEPTLFKNYLSKSTYGLGFIDDWERLVACQDTAVAFVESWARRIVLAGPKLVGITTTFQQNVPSIALARHIKAIAPEIIILLGGANCEAVMGIELLRSCPWIDGVVSGEADLIIAPICRHVLKAGCLPDDIDGLATRSNHLSVSAGEYVQELDCLPYPRYDDFFSAFNRNLDKTVYQPRVPFETSRGCWWGAKHHCTFCGLNGTSMTFRSKTADRALAELRDLWSEYPDLGVTVVDNILDNRYFNDFLPSLATWETKPSLFYETKANLRRSQIETLRAAGVTAIQPGIESMSTPVLALMRKGVSMLQNVQLLKLCKELGIQVFWNILWGFPGEDPADYEEVLRLLPLLAHLDPPGTCANIRLDRFSPNFDQAEARGFENVHATAAYSLVYPYSEDALQSIAYYFEFSVRGQDAEPHYGSALSSAVEWWTTLKDRASLFSVDIGKRLAVCDARQPDSIVSYVFTDAERLIVRYCDEIRSASELEIHLHNNGVDSESLPLDTCLSSLISKGLLLHESGRYLSLVVAVGVYGPPRDISSTFMRAIRETVGLAATASAAC